MSSAVVFTSAAQSRPFIFDEKDGAPVCPQPTGAELFGTGRPPQRVITLPGGLAADARLASVTRASRLAVRPAPEMVSSGIAALDGLTGGLPRGCLTEICGPASSGRTTLLLSVLAAATRRGEFCAVVDGGDALDPESVAAAGVELERLLWVRCGENAGRPEQCLEQLLRVADLLLESGGFGLIALDVGDLPPQTARRIPLATWFRFRRAVEHTPAVLLAIERQPIAGSCSSLSIKLRFGGKRVEKEDFQGVVPTHTQLLSGLHISMEVVRSRMDYERMDRKPARSAEVTFASKTAWAG
jgi:hypothetical protein